MRQLNDLGIATLLIDGFTTRGVADLANNPAQLGYLTMINDAYRALGMLAKHPRIDPSRIGILGGSREGLVALYASVKRFQRLHGAAGSSSPFSFRSTHSVTGPTSTTQTLWTVLSGYSMAPLTIGRW